MSHTKSTRHKENSQPHGSRGTHIDNLSENLSLRILSHLTNAEDIKAIASVSTSWARIASQVKAIVLPRYMRPEHAATFLGDKGCLESLEVPFSTMFQSRNPGFLLNVWSLAVPELKDLTVPFIGQVIHPAVLMTIAACFHRLQSLFLDNEPNPTYIDQDDEFFCAPAYFPCLQQLTIKGLGIRWYQLPDIMRGCPALTAATFEVADLDVAHEDDDEAIGLVAICIQHEKLKHLNISGPRRRRSQLQLKTPSLVDIETAAFDKISAAVSPELVRLSIGCRFLWIFPVPTQLEILSISEMPEKQTQATILQVLTSSKNSIQSVTPNMDNAEDEEFLGEMWQVLQRCPKAKHLTLHPELVVATQFNLSRLRALKELRVESQGARELFLNMDQSEGDVEVSWQQIISQLGSYCPGLSRLTVSCPADDLPDVNLVLEAQRLLKNVKIVVESRKDQ